MEFNENILKSKPRGLMRIYANTSTQPGQSQLL